MMVSEDLKFHENLLGTEVGATSLVVAENSSLVAQLTSSDVWGYRLLTTAFCNPY